MLVLSLIGMKMSLATTMRALPSTSWLLPLFWPKVPSATSHVRSNGLAVGGGPEVTHTGVALENEKSFVLAAPGPGGSVLALTVTPAGPRKPSVRTILRNN